MAFIRSPRRRDAVEFTSRHRPRAASVFVDLLGRLRERPFPTAIEDHCCGINIIPRRTHRDLRGRSQVSVLVRHPHVAAGSLCCRRSRDGSHIRKNIDWLGRLFGLCIFSLSTERGRVYACIGCYFGSLSP
jgi:hypothetical protein